MKDKVVGRVFTAQQILNEQIPVSGAFGKVREYIDDRLSRERDIHAALIFGSCVYGTQSCRSDFDCLVIYNFGGTTAVAEALTACINYSWRHHVPVRFIKQARDAISKSYCGLKSLLYTHLVIAARRGGVITGDPIELLRPLANASQDIYLRETLSYVAYKIDKLEEGQTCLGVMTEQERCHYYQKLLEAPMHLARKVATFAGHLQHEDSRADVLSAYGQLLQPQLVHDFEHLLGVDKAYSQWLDDTHTFGTYESYNDDLRTLHGYIAPTLSFLRANGAYLEEFVRSGSVPVHQRLF